MVINVDKDDELGSFTYEVPIVASLQFRTRRELQPADINMVLEIVRRELDKRTMHPMEIMLAHGVDPAQAAHRVRALCMPSWYDYPGEDPPGGNLDVQAAVVNLRLQEEDKDVYSGSVVDGHDIPPV